MTKELLNGKIFLVMIAVALLSFVNQASAQTFKLTGANVFDEPESGNSGAGEGGSNVDAFTVTTTLKTPNGTTTETGSLEVNDAGTYKGGSTDVSDRMGAPSSGTQTNTLANSKTSTGNQNNKKEEKAEDLKQYTGSYNGHQIMPDIMAKHCKIKGEDVAKNVNLYVNCIRQYVSEMNNPNAQEKARAEEEFNALRYKTLIDAASAAMTKSAVVSNYPEAMAKHQKAFMDAQTEFDDTHGMIAAISFVTDVLNSFRELQAEQLKYLAISGISEIDPAVIMAEEVKVQSESQGSGSSGGPDFYGVSANTKIE